MPQYQKVQSVAKKIQTRGEALDTIVLQTMKTISDIVGATLGPGGRQVLIERQEFGLPPMVTKDGVTVYRSLGFDDPAAQAVMEGSRDASVRTASEAGDGTTTATILAEAVVRLIKEYTQKNPRVSPQRVVRRLEEVFRDVIEPSLRKWSIKADLTKPRGRKLLKSVATISANGDVELADAVMKCFDLVGDNGNVTIAEHTGASHYEVEKIDGYPITIGYEESCAKFYPKFINDPGNQRVLLENPTFLIYHGRIQDPQSLFNPLSKLGYAFEAGQIGPNVVLVATGFSENVLGYLGQMFQASNALNVFPLLAPQSPFPNGQLDFLLDLAAITGSMMLDPLNAPLDQAEPEKHFGKATVFESYRFRSNVIGNTSTDTVLLRVDELQTNLTRAESQLDASYIQERLGKLTGGIARLKVIGASNGELKEKRDRAEDAVCAVRGAINHGCLPGGCWALLKLWQELDERMADPIMTEVLQPALMEPFRRLLENVGLSTTDDGEYVGIRDTILTGIRDGHKIVYDALEGRHVDALRAGILDSTPAVLEALRNSISIASLLGTLGGIVVFKRNADVERQEARDQAEFQRNAGVNEANERP
jgi:chaperonin GroEL